MANVRDRLGAIRAGTPMSAPGQGSGYTPMMGQGATVSGDVSAQASVQTTGILLIVLVVLVILGERMGR